MKKLFLIMLVVIIIAGYAACSGSQYIRQSSTDSVRVKSGKMHAADSAVH